MNMGSTSGCGVCSCYPAWLQPLADIKSFVLVFGVLGMFSWGQWTLAVSQVTNIERAFGMSSSETGWLFTIWELGYLVCIVTASNFTTKIHVPRAIGIFTLVNGVAGLMMIIPHFIVYNNLDNTTVISKFNEIKSNTATDEFSKYLCLNLTNTNATTGDEDQNPEVVNWLSQKTIAYVILCIAMALQGVGKGPCNPYSSQYIDDNCDKQKTGFYIGIILSINIFGLAMGYGIGSATSNFYVTLKDTVLKRTDTRYIGAWWLGFVILGLSIILIAIPMFCYPRHSKHEESSKDLEKYASKVGKHSEQRVSILKGAKGSSNTGHILVYLYFFNIISYVVRTILAPASALSFNFLFNAAGSSILHILKHPLYTLTLAASCIQLLAHASFMGFEPKYMQTQFAVPSWKANIIIGAASIGAYAIGSLVGGYMTKRFTMSPCRILLATSGLWLVVLVLNVVTTFLGCPHQDIYNPLDIEQSEDMSLSVCDCSSTQFIPICGNDGINYYSPCHAGCHNVTSEVYTNCVSIPGGMAKSGMCPTGCIMLWIYTAVKFITNLFDSTAAIPLFVVFLRSTGESHKAMAIALSGAIAACSAWLPGPIIGGKVIDSTCLIWNTASTGSQFCAYYNSEQQRYYVHALMIGLRVVAMGLLLMSIYKARNMKEWMDSSDTKETKATDSDDVKQKLPMHDL